ncbi:RNA polymerase sigma factor [Steroidobacter sp. S1-65]|uniref:RNA polymerase sigma factor n=1 Tax=Steroidobacter gossypii TaxID=2805490 RepID=A0ABS1WS31_9GAMM|nr:RNA polymerase sigma factor [Steroidobacter gossypii]MBM0103788.1 RNA polymerase sigma factor [Steroidobacter gossypii]
MFRWRKQVASSVPVAPAAEAAADPTANATETLVHLDRRYRRPLTSYFEKRIRESYDIDDLVQEVFIRLAHRPNFDNIEYLEGYVFQIAANVIRDRVRRRAVRHAADHDSLENSELPINDFSPERVLQGRQLLDRALGALTELPARTRHVFVLRLYEGMKQEEIAASLQISVETVRFHLRRAKEHMARGLEK